MTTHFDAEALMLAHNKRKRISSLTNEGAIIMLAIAALVLTMISLKGAQIGQYLVSNSEMTQKLITCRLWHILRVKCSKWTQDAIPQSTHTNLSLSSRSYLMDRVSIRSLMIKACVGIGCVSRPVFKLPLTRTPSCKRTWCSSWMIKNMCLSSCTNMSNFGAPRSSWRTILTPAASLIKRWPRTVRRCSKRFHIWISQSFGVKLFRMKKPASSIKKAKVAFIDRLPNKTCATIIKLLEIGHVGSSMENE